MPVNQADKTIRVYLSGPIADIPHEQAVDWRNRVAELSEPHIETVDPMSWQELWREDPELCAKRDLGEMYHSHVVLANFQHAPDPAVMRGTTFELAAWSAWQIIEQLNGSVFHGPAIGVYRDEEQVEALSPWLSMVTVKRFFDLDKAVQWLNLESSTWTTEGKPAEKPSVSSQEPSSTGENPASPIVGLDGQPLSSETLSGPDGEEKPTTSSSNSPVTS